MGGLKKIPSEGGSGGGRGHSAMEHWATTLEMFSRASRFSAAGVQIRGPSDLIHCGNACCLERTDSSSTQTHGEFSSSRCSQIWKTPLPRW